MCKVAEKSIPTYFRPYGNFLNYSLQDAGFKSRSFKDLRNSDIQGTAQSGFANCLLTEEDITLWVCFVCAAVIHVEHTVNLVAR